MIRSLFRALAFLATLLLVLPMIASAGVVIAQDATPTAFEPSAQPLAEAMPADVQAFVSTDFDLESDQYSMLTGLTARMLIQEREGTVAAIVERLAGFISLVPESARDVLDGEVGIGATGFRPLDLDTSGDTNALAGSVLPRYAICCTRTRPVPHGRSSRSGTPINSRRKDWSQIARKPVGSSF